MRRRRAFFFKLCQYVTRAIFFEKECVAESIFLFKKTTTRHRRGFFLAIFFAASHSKNTASQPRRKRKKKRTTSTGVMFFLKQCGAGAIFLFGKAMRHRLDFNTTTHRGREFLKNQSGACVNFQVSSCSLILQTACKTHFKSRAKKL